MLGKVAKPTEWTTGGAPKWVKEPEVAGRRDCQRARACATPVRPMNP